MRHNETSGRIRVPAVALLIAGVLLFSADTALSQAHRTARKNDKKTAEQKKKEAPKAEEKKSRENGAAEEPAQNTADGKETGGEKKDAAKEAPGDLNLGEYSEDDFRPQVEEESTAWLFFKTIFVLGSIVGGFYFFFKFVNKKTGIQLLGGEVAKVLSVVPLGQNKYIQVVDMAGKLLVLGITDSSINVLTEIREKDEIDRIRILSSKTVAQKVEGFQEFLTAQIGRVMDRVGGLRNRGGATVVEEEHVAGDIDYLRAHRNRLRDLNGDGGEKE